MRSRWPAWRAVSSSMCTSTQRNDTWPHTCAAPRSTRRAIPCVHDGTRPVARLGVHRQHRLDGLVARSSNSP
jgi:hypothetical protein